MNHAIILAAGQGQRMSMRQDKMLLSVAGKPILYHSLMAFNDHPEIDNVIVVANKQNKEEISKMIKFYHFPKVRKVILGSLARQNSVGKGLEELTKYSKDKDVVLVHNGANPLPSADEISKVIKNSEEHGACIVGHKITSTVKETKGAEITKTHDRKKLFTAETPQAATVKLMKKALNNTKKKKLEVTDEAMMLEAIGQKVVMVEAHEDNFKITTQADLARLRMVLGDVPEDFRVGIGQDSHMFEEEKKGLVLGGVKIKDEFKLKANSDGDVVLHAVFNALSQAIGDMSIGFYADEMCEGGEKNSEIYVKFVLEKIKKEKFKVNSLGLMIEGAHPQIDPLVPRLKKSLSAILGVPPARIGITATSGEKCTVFGEGLGLQCFAIASLRKV